MSDDNQERLPSQDRLNQLLSYDRETGSLTWKWRTIDMVDGPTIAARIAIMRRLNSGSGGKPAFATPDRKGYLHGRLDKTNFFAHRVIWKMTYGEEPGTIDHINHIPTDNRLCNLRAATREEQSKNASLRRSNRSGRIGVRRVAVDKWLAKIGHRGQEIHLGTFPTADAAIAARVAAEAKFGFHPNHGREVSPPREPYR